MRNILQDYRIFDIDPKKSRSRDFYKNMLQYRAHVMKKFASAIKKPSEFSCPLCGSKKGKEFLALGKYKLYECPRCALVSPNIDFSKAGGSEMYDDPKNIKDTTREIVATYGYRKKVHAPERLAYLMEMTGLKKSQIRLLDVGCGPAYFLSHLKDVGVRGKGLELTEFLVDIGRRKGVDVASTELSQEKPASYTALTLFDVLEHLTDPIEFFKDANRALKKGGYMMAYSPNIHSLAFVLMGNRQNTLYPYQHTAFFDKKSLEYLAKKTGFVLHSLEFYGLDVMDYLCMKQYDDRYDYFDKLREAVPLLQAVIDKQGLGNHLRVIFKKTKNV